MPGTCRQLVVDRSWHIARRGFFAPDFWNGRSAENVSTNATTYAWDLGDGSPPSAVVSPTHTYTQAGVYTVTLHASDGAVTDTLTRPAYVWTTSVSQGMQGWWRLEEADGRHPWAGRATTARPTATT